MEETLYGLVGDIEAIYDEIYLEQGEIDEKSESLLIETKFLLEKKTDGIVAARRKRIDLRDAIKGRVKELQGALKTLENKIESVDNYILYCMKSGGITHVEGSLTSIKLRKPSVVVEVYDENLLNDKYVATVTTKKISKVDIKEDLKKGVDVQGAKLIDGKQGLNIKIR